MSLEVRYEKVASSSEAWDAVKSHITPELIAKFKVKADVDYNEANKKIKAKGKGFELNINLLDDKAVADIKLSLLLKPLKGKVLEGIEKQLKRVV
jgi:hypothetical protein